MSRIDELNDGISRQCEEWRRTELPKVRAAIFESGFASYEQLRDNIVSPEELTARGFVQDEWTKNWSTPGFH